MQGKWMVKLKIKSFWPELEVLTSITIYLCIDADAMEHQDFWAM